MWFKLEEALSCWMEAESSLNDWEGLEDTLKGCTDIGDC